MTEQKGTNTNIESLMDMLANKDGIIRQKAREESVFLGEPAVSSLISMITHSRTCSRGFHSG
jgi:hypothetical protein